MKVNPIVPPEPVNNNSESDPEWNKKNNNFRDILYEKMRDLGSTDPLADILRYKNRNLE